MICNKFKFGIWLCLLAVAVVRIASADDRIHVFVSILPQKIFVEKIGGHLVDVSVMVLPGSNPATFEPRPSQMVALAKAKLYLAIGVPFEEVWLKKISGANPYMLIVHTEDGIEKRFMGGHSHDHGEEIHGQSERERQEGIKDPHVWLSPRLVMTQAGNILEALKKVDTDHSDLYEANYKRFAAELAGLDEELRTLLAGVGKNSEFMVFHPAWGYFAEAYGLSQVPVEVEGKEPKPTELKRLIEHAIERGIRVIFVQPQFPTKKAELIARAVGGRIAIADPLSPDWADNLRRMAKELASAIR